MIDSIAIETFAMINIIAIVCIATLEFCCLRCYCHDRHAMENTPFAMQFYLLREIIRYCYGHYDVASVSFATQYYSLQEIICYCHGRCVMAKYHFPHNFIHCHKSYCLISDFVAIDHIATHSNLLA
jgi:hypothetical protein